jgi:hypothetical protein
MLAAAPRSSPEVISVRRQGRLYVGPFLVPDRPFLLPSPCPICSGVTYYDDGEFRCLLCARELRVAAISPEGRVEMLAPLEQAVPVGPVRVATGQYRRTARALSKADGVTGLGARVLRLVPYGPTSYAVVEQISRVLSIRREHARDALDRLESQGQVERFTFNSGYRVGYRRVARVAGREGRR